MPETAGYEVTDSFLHAELVIIEESALIMWLDQQEHYYTAVSQFLGRHQ